MGSRKKFLIVVHRHLTYFLLIFMPAVILIQQAFYVIFQFSSLCLRMKEACIPIPCLIPVDSRPLQPHSILFFIPTIQFHPCFLHIMNIIRSTRLPFKPFKVFLQFGNSVSHMSELNFIPSLQFHSAFLQT